MRNYIYWLLLCLCPAELSAQPHVISLTPTVESANMALLGDTEVQRTIQYFNRFGNPEVKIQYGFTPMGDNLVTLQQYDGLGRESNLWLPIIKSRVTGGNYLSLEEIIEGAKGAAVYGSDPSPYSKTVYDGSPQSFVVEQYGPGNDWHVKGRSVKTDRMTNLSVVDARTNTSPHAMYLTVSVYTPTNTGLANTGTYPSGSLCVIRMTDEDNNISFEFKDKAGRTVLVRQIENGRMCDTYHVYDDYGKKRMVLPPEASDKLAAVGSWEDSHTTLQQYAYIYKYDACNRCIWKKLPGCEPIYYVYDGADRLIFSQDGEQRAKNEWSFSIPDVFGQVVLTGVCKNTFDYTADSLEGAVVKAEWAKVNNVTKGYSIAGVTLVVPTVLIANYYDNYEFTGLNAVPDTVANGSPTKYEAVSDYGTRYMGGCKGLLTGTLTACLAHGTESPEYLYSVMYYDNRSRIIQSKSDNHLGGEEKVYTAYNFTGQPVMMKHVHSAAEKDTQTEIYTYAYDHVGRLKTTKHQLNDASETLLVDNEHDELGRLKNNKRNSQVGLVTDYSYNIRSWMKSLTGTHFSQTLYYQDSYAGNTPSYSGNISAMSWTTHADKKRGYTFNYDNLARLKKAAYLEADLANTNYNTGYEYDKHGNITSLTRRGRMGASAFGVVDALTLNYNGNQLVKVTDAAVNPTLSGAADFKDDANQAAEYTYDQNGSMKTDLNKGISDISYNSLNLPSKLIIANSLGSATNTYIYAADGRKLNVTMQWGASNSKSTDYAGSKIYENGSLKRILVDGGYIESGIYHYYLQDHLGNNRVVAKADGTVVQTNHYYPFGMAFAEGVQNSNQPFKYNGKELDAERGLNLYDYMARYMDAALGRFTTVDPMAEKYYSISPYVYCGNNPINRIDPDGRNWYQSTNNKDKYIWREGHKDIDGYSNIGSSVSVQIGNDSYLNFYQNAGIKANKAVNAFDLITSSEKLQNQLLGKNSPLSEESKSALFNGLNSRAVDGIARPIGEALVSYAAAELGGIAAGRLIQWGVGRLLSGSGGKGGLNLFKWGAEQTTKSNGWKADDYMLYLPDKGSPKLNWKANYSALRREMGSGTLIYDSYRLPNGNIIPTGGFLNAERYTLQTRGWIYSPQKGAWLPPIK